MESGIESSERRVAEQLCAFGPARFVLRFDDDEAMSRVRSRSRFVARCKALVYGLEHFDQPAMRSVCGARAGLRSTERAMEAVCLSRRLAQVRPAASLRHASDVTASDTSAKTTPFHDVRALMRRVPGALCGRHCHRALKKRVKSANARGEADHR
ncbi:MAG: hypothetical protein H6720_15760 [Sandaracinus sp.]|nr:hypothetical protein [Sandaracinus sp.]